MLSASAVAFNLPAQSVLIGYGGSTAAVYVIFANAATTNYYFGRVGGCGALCELCVFQNVISGCYCRVVLSQQLTYSIEVLISVKTAWMPETAVYVISFINRGGVEGETLGDC